MKKVVIFGGGTGMSQILKGLKLFPLDITAVVSVSDSGRSTGTLRKIYDTPAVGDITKVLITMSNLEEDTINLLNYRIKGSNPNNDYNHSLKNLILTALTDMHGNLDNALSIFCKIFNIVGKILPLTNESVNLIAKTTDGEIIVGEDDITEAKKKIEEIYYDKDFAVNPKVFKALAEADLIIMAPGSLYTSILPHIIAPKMKEAINNSKAKKIYICNLVSQPGESIDYSASKHVETLNKYLENNTINAIVANNRKISRNLTRKYETREQKLPITFDKKELDQMNIEIIADKIYTIENGVIRHDSLKTAYLIFSYLMRS